MSLLYNDIQYENDVAHQAVPGGRWNVRLSIHPIEKETLGDVKKMHVPERQKATVAWGTLA